MAKKIFLFLIVSTTLFASQGEPQNSTDIVWRTINFVVFAAILWYLTAKPIKNFFVGRSERIADELKSVQDKLLRTKEARDQALKEVQNAKKIAEEILELSKKENRIVNESIAAQCEADIKILKEHATASMELEKRKMVKEVTAHALEELLKQEETSFSKKEMAEIILSKVA